MRKTAKKNIKNKTIKNKSKTKSKSKLVSKNKARLITKIHKRKRKTKKSLAYSDDENDPLPIKADDKINEKIEQIYKLINAINIIDNTCLT
uniref:Uncharacterized protein n=1 Tax=viral metagenome TaxID=1070528 RepID=A0A6C0D053_9ZZZZ